MIDHPKAKVDKLMEFLPVLTSPTGAIVQGRDEIKKAYETGKGHVVVRSRTEIESSKAAKSRLLSLKFLRRLTSCSGQED